MVQHVWAPGVIRGAKIGPQATLGHLPGARQGKATGEREGHTPPQKLLMWASLC